MFTLVLPPADLFVLSNTFLSRMYIVCLFSCIFSANSPCWVWMLARLIECVAFCWIGRTLFENQQPHRQRWEDTDLREIVNIFHLRLDMDFGILEKKMAKLSWFQVCLFCVCVLLTFLGSIVSTVQARGRGDSSKCGFPQNALGNGILQHQCTYKILDLITIADLKRFTITLYGLRPREVAGWAYFLFGRQNVWSAKPLFTVPAHQALITWWVILALNTERHVGQGCTVKNVKLT